MVLERKLRRRVPALSGPEHLHRKRHSQRAAEVALGTGGPLICPPLRCEMLSPC